MGTKTIGIREDVYDRLKARKREDESFTDLVDRLLEEATDWREGYGSRQDLAGGTLRDHLDASRDQTGQGLAARQDELTEQLSAEPSAAETDGDHDES